MNQPARIAHRLLGVLAALWAALAVLDTATLRPLGAATACAACAALLWGRPRLVQVVGAEDPVRCLRAHIAAPVSALVGLADAAVALLGVRRLDG